MEAGTASSPAAFGRRRARRSNIDDGIFHGLRTRESLLGVFCINRLDIFVRECARVQLEDVVPLD